MRYLSKPLKEIHDAILRNEVTPLDLVKEGLSYVGKDNNNAFEYICNKEAIDAVNKLDSSKKNSLLYGVPIVIKDCFSTKSIPTTASSNMLSDYIPCFDAEVVTRLKNAGAIIIGKTTMDELAMGGSGTSGRKGMTYNPWDKRRKHIIGGSSCGSAAAVSSGLTPIGIGSDTGDSVRKPASYSGFVGFKPTWGRISRYGMFQFASSLDHVAYFTRNVFDSAYLLNVLAGHDNKDFSSGYEDIIDYTKDLSKSIKGKRIAVIKEVLDCCSPKIKECFNKTLDQLRAEGAIVDIVSIDEKILKAIYPTYFIISSSEATSNNANLDGLKFGSRCEGNSFEEVMINTRTKCFSPLIKRRFIIGSLSLSKTHREELFVRAQKCRRLIVDSFNKVFEKYDFIYCPASPTTAPLFKGYNPRFNGDVNVADNYLAFANFGGNPSITIPIGFENNMPFGGNFTAKPHFDSELLNVASILEKHTGLMNLVKENE